MTLMIRFLELYLCEENINHLITYVGGYKYIKNLAKVIKNVSNQHVCKEESEAILNIKIKRNNKKRQIIFLKLKIPINNKIYIYFLLMFYFVRTNVLISVSPIFLCLSSMYTNLFTPAIHNSWRRVYHVFASQNV